MKGQKETVDYRPREREDLKKPAPLQPKEREYYEYNSQVFSRRPVDNNSRERVSKPVVIPRRRKDFSSLSSRAESRDSSFERVQKQEADRKRKLDKLRDLRDKQQKEELRDRPKITPYKLKKPRDELYRTERSKEAIEGGKTTQEIREERELKSCTFYPTTNNQKRKMISSSALVTKNKVRRPSVEDEGDIELEDQPNLAQHKVDPSIEAFNSVDENDPGDDVVGRNAEELLKWGREKDSKLAAKRVQAASSIEKECTFNPKINSRSAKMPLKDYVPPEQRYNNRFIKPKSKEAEENTENLFRPKINEKSVEILRRRRQELEIEREAMLKELADQNFIEENLQNKSFYSKDSSASEERRPRMVTKQSRSPKLQTKKRISRSRSIRSRNGSPSLSKKNTRPRAETKPQINKNPTVEPTLWRSPSKSKSRSNFAQNGMPILNTGVASVITGVLGVGTEIEVKAKCGQT